MIEFRKKHGDSLLNDWQRLLALEQVCEKVDGAMTPKALRNDLKTSTIIYEHWALHTPLASLVGHPYIYTRVGQILAKVHREPFDIDMRTFSRAPYPLLEIGIDPRDADILDAYFPPAWFHGDFWHGNVFIQPNDNVVIIDPLPSQYMLNTKHICAPAYLDIAFMYMSIIFCHPLRKQIYIDIDKHILAAEHFLEGYIQEQKITCPEVLNSIRRVSRVLALRFIRGHLSRLRWPLSSIKYFIALQTLYLTDKKINWEI